MIRVAQQFDSLTQPLGSRSSIRETDYLVEQNKIRTAEADIAPLDDLLNSLNEDPKVQ
jgi:hypothetical protein